MESIVSIPVFQQHINPAFEPDDNLDEGCEAGRCSGADPVESGPDPAVQSGAERKYAVIRVTPATPSQSVDRSRH